jgi:4'-phosphopantetheinyl transferase
MRRPGLDGRDVHLWIVRLEGRENAFPRSLSLLDSDEMARVERFHFDRHRRAFALGRAALRLLLGKYLDISPRDVWFIYGPQGKPALADPSCALRFNVSNSANLAACVFTIGCEIGVDIEQHRPLHDFEGIAHRFFSPEETAELFALPQAEKHAAFFRCWSRKEAYIKAMGGGLSIPLDSFQVSLGPGVEARMVTLGGSAEAARGWNVHDFVPAPDCAGAIAYCGATRSIEWNPIVSAGELIEEAIA